MNTTRMNKVLENQKTTRLHVTLVNIGTMAAVILTTFSILG